MKKSNKKENPNPKEILKDTNKILDLIDKLDNINIETLNIESIEKEINFLQKNFNKKYKNILSEESKNNLDSEK